MKANEIWAAKFEYDDGAWESARWLQEIAAQLAEHNELMREEKSRTEEVFGASKPSRPGDDGKIWWNGLGYIPSDQVRKKIDEAVEAERERVRSVILRK